MRVINEREYPLRSRVVGPAQEGQPDFAALAYNPTDGYLYGVTLPPPSQRPTIVRLDGQGAVIASAVLSEAGEGWSFLAVDIAVTGDVYLLRLGSEMMHTIRSRDLHAMQGFGGTLPFDRIVTTSGMGMLSQILDVAFHPSEPNSLYAFDNHIARVVRIDTVTHTMKPIGPAFLTLRTIHSVFFDAFASLYALQDNGHLWTLPILQTETLAFVGGMMTPLMFPQFTLTQHFLTICLTPPVLLQTSKARTAR